MQTIQGINGNDWGRLSPVYKLEWVVGDDTLDPDVTTVDSSTVVDDNLIGCDVEVFRGNVPLPAMDPGDGSEYYTKVKKDNTVTFSNTLVDGEHIKIKTI